MSQNIHYLHSRPRQIAQFTRVGYSDHVQTEQLLSAGKLDGQRFVIDAANFERQSSLIRSIHDENAEIVLDTNVAELSAPGRFSSAVRAAPWSNKDRPLEIDDFFIPSTNRTVVDQVADFAVEKKISSVMAPTHYLGEDQYHWFEVDRRACIALRQSLDRKGGAEISIDYPLIITYSQFRDPEFRDGLINGLRDMPFDCLWLRISGFGADSKAAAVARCIKGLFSFHALGRPIIADQVGGLASLALCAFGASSGFSHGISGKERFSAKEWLKPKTEGSFGQVKTVYIPALDRRLKIRDARKMFEDARTSREMFGCPDHTCCGDIERMLSYPEAHLMVQKGRQVSDLSQTPETMRADRLISEHIELARRLSGRAMNLKKIDDDAKKKISNANTRLIRFEETLTNLHEQLGPTNFANELSGHSGDRVKIQKGPWHD